MNILVSPTAFKGTLSPKSAAHIMAQAARSVFPKSSIHLHPLADGGDGTLEVLLDARKGQIRKNKVMGPLGKSVQAKWGFIKASHTALVEMAEASGLKLVHGKNRIRDASTVGSGQLIHRVLDAGCRTILLGVGGTATADGGAGALGALGARFFDRHGRKLNPVPSELIHLDHMDGSGLDPRLRKTHLIVLCDVTNPLLGSRGSARVFGPQKGASQADVRFLEKFLRHWSRFARYQTKNKPGAGAAGAMAFGLSGFLGARLVDGGKFILEATSWKRAAGQADLILTGEGRVDRTSFSGKVLGAVTNRRGRARVLAVCGSSPLSPKQLRQNGISDFELMGEKGMSNPEKELRRSTEKLLRRFSLHSRESGNPISLETLDPR